MLTYDFFKLEQHRHDLILKFYDMIFSNNTLIEHKNYPQYLIQFFPFFLPNCDIWKSHFAKMNVLPYLHEQIIFLYPNRNEMVRGNTVETFNLPSYS
jgi:hypothetical protein